MTVGIGAVVTTIRRLAGLLPHRLAVVLGVVIVSAVGASCGGGSSGDDAAEAQAEAVRAARKAPLFRGNDAEVVALDNDFEPEVFKVRAGTEVTFTNEGRLRHNVIPVGHSGFEIRTDQFEPGDAQTVTLADTGTFRYYCSIHGTPTRGMIGTLAVVQ